MRVEPEVRDAILAQDYDGFWDWMVTRDNPNRGKDVYRNVQIAYEKMRRIALAEKYDAVWIVEADTIPPPDALRKLSETPAEIVTGLYVLRHGVNQPNLFSYGRSPEIGSGYEWEFVNKQKGPVIPTSGGCMGCVLVKTSVLDFNFEIESPRAPDMEWMRHNWKKRRVTMARLDVQCGHKDAEGVILHPGQFGMREWA